MSARGREPHQPPPEVTCWGSLQVRGFGMGGIPDLWRRNPTQCSEGPGLAPISHSVSARPPPALIFFGALVVICCYL